MVVVLSLLLGAFLGWVYSVVVRSDTNERIIIDILVGALGAVPMTLALGNNAFFDGLVAAFLGAFVALGILFLIRGRLESHRR